MDFKETNPIHGHKESVKIETPLQSSEADDFPMHFSSDLHFLLRKKSALHSSQTQPERLGAFQRP